MGIHLRRLQVGIVLIASAVAAASARTRTKTAIEIGVDGRANASASIATSGSFVAIVWAARTQEGVTDIYATTSRDGGQSFRAPVRVNQVAGAATVSGEQPPRVALIARKGGDPSVAAMWTAKASDGTRLVTARSDDGGRSFAPAESVPGSDASGNRGWESMAINRAGDLVGLWLDHREVAHSAGGATMNAEHQHGATSHHKSVGGVVRAQLSQVFFAKLKDPASARAIATGVCYCCKTAMAVGNDGAVYAAWRHVYPGNVRDIAFTMSRDGGKTFEQPVRVSDDHWVLDGCPENGPAMTVDGDHRIHVIWPTLVPGAFPDSEPTLALFYAMSQDGRQFTARQRIPTEGFPRHPQIALGLHGGVVVVWDEQAGGNRRIALARGTVDANGRAQFVRQGITDDASATYPIVATADSHTIVAWTSGSTGRTVVRAERVSP